MLNNVISASLFLFLILSLAPAASGYATNLSLLGCACKWDKDKIVIWIHNTQEDVHTDMVTAAFVAWEESFPRLQYSIHSTEPDSWDIRVVITEKYVDKEVTNTLARTTIHASWSTGTIEKVDILIPTHLQNDNNGEQELVRIPDDMFYNLILHETGHAIGLGHAIDNERGMIDPMFEKIGKDEAKRSISELDIMTLERLYR